MENVRNRETKRNGVEWRGSRSQETEREDTEWIMT